MSDLEHAQKSAILLETIDKQYAELTRLRELVGELKEALGTLMDVQNGAPLYTWTDRWNDAMAQAKAALEKQ